MVTVITKKHVPSPLAVFGKTLAEGIPKIMEQRNLSKGLQQLEQDAPNLTPQQYYTRALQIPGLTPEAQRQLGENSRQMARGQALQQQNIEKPSPFPQNQETNQVQKKDPYLTNQEDQEKVQEGYIPPTREEELSRAGELYNKNSALFNNNPDQAIKHVQEETVRNQEIATAYENRDKKLTALQDDVKDRLGKHTKGLFANIPPNIYSNLETEALNAVKSKSKGGRGLKVEEAVKEYGEKADQISRQYQSVKTLGDPSIVNNDAKDIRTNLKSIQKDFKKRDDTINLANKFISETKLSPSKAYSLAQPVSDYKETNNYLTKLPKIGKKIIVDSEHPNGVFPKQYGTEKTIDIAPELAKLVKKEESSPLAIREQLNSLGYDGDLFLDYLKKNKDALNLTSDQNNQLNQPTRRFPTLNDLWLFDLSDLEPLMEIE
jgi:hypothetical protein